MMIHSFKFLSSSIAHLMALTMIMVLGSVVNSQIFDPESMVWTIDGLGYNDFTVFICYGGQGKTTTPLFGSGASPRQAGITYADVTSLINNVFDSGATGCFPRFVEDPSDVMPFLGDCDLDDDSVVTVCFGPRQNAPAFQCGRYDWILAATVRVDPEGPSPNCRPCDNWLFCPPDGKTRFYRYSFQEPRGIIFGSAFGSCNIPFFWGLNTDGILCGDGSGSFLTDHGGYWTYYNQPACYRPSLDLLDWVCPSDPNYPRSTGCRDRRIRSLSVEKEMATQRNDTSSFTFDGAMFENVWSMDAFAGLKNRSSGFKPLLNDKIGSNEDSEEMTKLDLVMLQTHRPQSEDNGTHEHVERESSGSRSAIPSFNGMVMEAWLYSSLLLLFAL